MNYFQSLFGGLSFKVIICFAGAFFFGGKDVFDFHSGERGRMTADVVPSWAWSKSYNLLKLRLAF